MPQALGQLLLLTLLASSVRAEEISPHAFQKLVERTRGAVVRVTSRPEGTAVIIGVHGELLAPAQLVKGKTLVVELKGQPFIATLREKDAALGLALLSLDAGDYPAATVGTAAGIVKGSFLLGLAFDRKGKLATSTGTFDRESRAKDGAVRLRTDVAGPIGTALFNARGELVAIHAGARLSTVPIDAVRARFAPRPAP